MKTSDTPFLNEDLFKDMAPSLLGVIKIKGAQMDAEIAAKMEKLKDLIVEGVSSDGFVKARLNGDYQVIDIAFDPSYPAEELNKPQACALVAEAINDATYKVDLTIETEISTIQYKYTSEVINLGH